MLPSLESARRPLVRSLALLVAGVLMLLAAFLLANPWFGSGRAAWPWEVMATSTNLLVTANWTLWFSTAALAIPMSLWTPARWRAPLLGGLTLVLLFTCHSGVAGLHVTSQSLAWFVGACLLLGGFLLQLQPEAPPAARMLTILGALVLLWSMAGSFQYAEDRTTHAQLHQLLLDMGARLGVGDSGAPSTTPDDTLWAYAFLLVGCLLGLFARGPRASWIGIAAVLLCFLIPTFSHLGRVLGATGRMVTIAHHFSEVLIDAGLTITWLGAAVIADFVRAAETRP